MKHIIFEIEKNPKKFFKLCNRGYHYPTVYTDILPSWKRNDKKRKALKWVLRKTKWPNEVSQIISLAGILTKNYNHPINNVSIRETYDLWVDYKEDISDFIHKRYLSTVNNKGYNSYRFKIGKQKAIEEQVARGFIELDDYEDYDPEAAHIFSNARNTLIYPQNFHLGTQCKDLYEMGIYEGMALIGVYGWTRTVETGLKGITNKT